MGGPEFFGVVQGGDPFFSVGPRGGGPKSFEGHRGGGTRIFSQDKDLKFSRLRRTPSVHLLICACKNVSTKNILLAILG